MSGLMLTWAGDRVIYQTHYTLQNSSTSGEPEKMLRLPQQKDVISCKYLSHHIMIISDPATTLVIIKIHQMA